MVRTVGVVGERFGDGLSRDATGEIDAVSKALVLVDIVAQRGGGGGCDALHLQGGEEMGTERMAVSQLVEKAKLLSISSPLTEKGHPVLECPFMIL